MPVATPTLVFVRHGETDWNVAGRLQGQRDIPINTHGRAQARRNGEVIARSFADVAAFDFVASPLSRARETMEIVRATIGLDRGDYRTDDRLREITFGAWESYTIDEIRRRSPGAVAAREKDKWGFQPPGGESYARLAARVKAWLAELARPTLVVAHGGVGRVLWIELAGVGPAAAVAIDVPHDKVFLWQDGAASLI